MTALRGIDTRLKLARLLLITDTRADAGDLADFADAALAGGVDIVELRDDRASGPARLAALRQLRTVGFRYQALVAVHADEDLAREFDTDVLHLDAGGPSAEAARRFLHPFAVVGRSCHSAAEVDAALADPAVAFLTVGPVVGGLPLAGAPGPDLVWHAATAAPPADPRAKPWFAVGGITAANLDEVLAAGARRVAVARAVTEASDPGEAARLIKHRLRDAWNDDPAMERVVFDAFRQPQAGAFADPVFEADPKKGGR